MYEHEDEIEMDAEFRRNQEQRESEFADEDWG